ncbi:NAD(P)-binding protein [Exidia glandulosa HHB12029]|uniref:NAD(P)-binding protein n=1 Tax=Exidia glandulosa HHB12029 TaxID=1314781 RepID=A0A165DG99_EXIGL|nr:NAD(P)-binding protein [Exidia glandulosa HHB12029]
MGILDDIFPPKATWTAEDIPDCSGKVFLVTGGNSGIGLETTKQLLRKGGKVYLAARSKAKADEAITELERETGKRAIFHELDLGNFFLPQSCVAVTLYEACDEQGKNLAAVKRSALEFASKESRLDVLINNAGVMVPPVELVTSDGYDLQFGTNVIGHFVFTKHLLPTILSTAESNPSSRPRVITVSSMGHRIHPSIEYDTLRDCDKRRTMNIWHLYGQSKFGNILVANELARRYGDQIVSISLHPGGVKTNLSRHRGGGLMAKITRFFFADPSLGAVTQLYAATAPEAAEMNGKYLIPWARVGEPNPAAAKCV